MSFTTQQVQILKSKLLQKVKEKNESSKKQLNILTINYVNFEKMQPVIKSILEHHFKDIVELKINNCDLRTLENFPHLPHLTDLSVAKNSLQGSFQFIVKNRRIKYIDATDNIIKDIRKFEPLKRLKKVSLYAKNNPFLANSNNLTGKESIASKLQLLGITLLDKSKEALAAKQEIKKQKEDSKKITSNAANKVPTKVKQKKKQMPYNNLFTIRTSRNQEIPQYNHQRIKEILRLCRQSDYNNINNDDMRLYRRLPLSIQRTSSIQEGLQNMRRRTQALNAEGRQFPSQRIRPREAQYFQVLDGMREQYAHFRRNRSPPRRATDVWAAQEENNENEVVPLIPRNNRQNNNDNSAQRGGSENILWQNSPPRLEVIRNEEQQEEEDPFIDELSFQDLQNEEEEQGEEDEEEPRQDLSSSSISSRRQVEIHLGNELIDLGEMIEDSQNQRRRSQERNMFARSIFDVFEFGKESNQENEQDK